MGILIRCAGHNGPAVGYRKNERQGGALHRPYDNECPAIRRGIVHILATENAQQEACWCSLPATLWLESV